MNKQKADEIITEYLPKIYGFSVKKAFTYDEAEELSAMIVEEVYTSLLKMDDIYNIDGYIRRISKYVYARYVSSVKRHEGISIDGLEIPYEQDFTLPEEAEEELLRIRREIAFLTKSRREIVYSFYFENKKIAQIANDMGIPEGTVKWHLNRARNEMKEGFTMERKIGKLGLNPVRATGFGHGGHTGSNDGPEYYLGDSLNLNIVYSVYHTPRTKEEIAEELGVTLVFIEERIATLEENGFLVRQAGDKYTTYVIFTPQTYSLEFQENAIKKWQEIAQILVEKYVPEVRRAVAKIKDIYIPGGNRELLDAAMIYFGIRNFCWNTIEKDMSKYNIKTTAGGDFLATVFLEKTRSDLEYMPTLFNLPDYSGCGDMNRYSEKYPAVGSWSIDTRYSSRVGAWKNNHNADYEYLYEHMIGAISADNAANEEKYKRLHDRGFIDEDNKVNIMVLKGNYETITSTVPHLDEEISRMFADMALEYASAVAKDYPIQMHDLVIVDEAGSFIANNIVALMVMDTLYSNGTFRPLTENERVTSNLIMFSDVIPE